jgi:acyl-CoA synthetase (AMP-forming)/AMP-acid ligase II
MKYIIDYMQEWAERMPSHPALIFHENHISYQLLYERAMQAAAGLLNHQIKPGDRIVYMLPPSPDFYYLYLGASILGSVCVGLNVRSKAAQVSAFLRDKKPSLFVVDRSLVGELPRDLTATAPVLLSDDLTLPVTPSARAQMDRYRSAVQPDTPVFEIYTSGTTGESKGAILTQRSILAACLAQLREFGAPRGYQVGDMVQQLFPVNHVSGAVEFGVAPLLCGSSLSVHPSFSPQGILDDVRNNPITMLAGVPAMWEALLHHPAFPHCDFSRIRWCGIGAAPVREETLKRMLDICGVISNPLGMTELSGFCSGFGGTTDWSLLRDTVGRIIPELEWKIMGDDAKAVRTGEIGQLAYRGASVISHYTNGPVKTTDDGFFLSGDLAYCDDAGYIHLRGRADDIFQVGGYNVNPVEIENEILSHPDILQAVVVPAPHKTMGCVCQAYIVPEKGRQIDTKQLIAWLEDRLIYYHIPRTIHIRDHLPTNELGKISRRALIAQLTK